MKGPVRQFGGVTPTNLPPGTPGASFRGAANPGGLEYAAGGGGSSSDDDENLYQCFERSCTFEDCQTFEFDFPYAAANDPWVAFGPPDDSGVAKQYWDELQNTAWRTTALWKHERRDTPTFTDPPKIVEVPDGEDCSSYCPKRVDTTPCPQGTIRYEQVPTWFEPGTTHDPNAPGYTPVPDISIVARIKIIIKWEHLHRTWDTGCKPYNEYGDVDDKVDEEVGPQVCPHWVRGRASTDLFWGGRGGAQVYGEGFWDYSTRIDEFPPCEQHGPFEWACFSDRAQIRREEWDYSPSARPWSKMAGFNWRDALMDYSIFGMDDINEMSQRKQYDLAKSWLCNGRQTDFFRPLSMCDQCERIQADIKAQKLKNDDYITGCFTDGGEMCPNLGDEPC